jgi:cytochrome oxidase Cu insertion factor (SCO1/SenC/PrrC family)
MSGMGSGTPTAVHAVVVAFYTAVMHQLLAIFALLIVASLAWNVLRNVQYRRAVAQGRVDGAPAPSAIASEPRGRLVLRLAFGVLWTIDGLLQLQASMPLGLPSGVFSPASAGAPGWVQGVVSVSVTNWTNHPITMAVAAVWIQLGLGALLLVAPRGTASRAAGLGSAGWGLVVWVFGEAFGGIFTPGQSFLFGAPGAALFYVVAGVLLFLPDRAWCTPTLGRRVLRAFGCLFVGAAALQAWPGRRTWTGQPTAHSTPGLTTTMVQQMSGTHQPSAFASIVRSFASFDAAHGWGVNLAAVVALAALGAMFLTGDRRVARLGVAASVVLCLADWVLIQDLGFFGGVGTDPNSMLPIVSLLVVAYLALVRPGAAPLAVPAARPSRARWFDERSSWSLLQWAAACCAGAIVLIGAAPMALAATNPASDAIAAEALDGAPVAVNVLAPPFLLHDQYGRSVALADFQGKVVVLTFLDPVCTTDCPLIAQELKVTDALLGSDAARVEIVAIDINPMFRSPAVLRAFDSQEGLSALTNFRYLTGTGHELQALWKAYHVSGTIEPGGAMVNHANAFYVIDRFGVIRVGLAGDPSPSSAVRGSFASLLAGQVDQVVHQ